MENKECYICQPNKYKIIPGAVLPVCKEHLNPFENKEMKDRFEDWYSKYEYYPSASEIKAFIQSEKDLAVAKREEDMANEIITFINSGHRCASDTGYSIDLNDVEDFIKNLITKHK